MDNFDYSAIGKRIRILRKRKGYNQQELANIIGKSLRTVQKYESGEIEVSIAVVNQLAEVLETTPTFILGYEADIAPVRSLADVMNFLFHIEQVSGLDFSIDVKKPPRSREWTCSITFDGKKADADFNTDLCLFLEQWEEQREDLPTPQRRRTTGNGKSRPSRTTPPQRWSAWSLPSWTLRNELRDEMRI